MSTSFSSLADAAKARPVIKVSERHFVIISDVLFICFPDVRKGEKIQWTFTTSARSNKEDRMPAVVQIGLSPSTRRNSIAVIHPTPLESLKLRGLSGSARLRQDDGLALFAHELLQ